VLRRYIAPVTLLLDRHAFLEEHRRCGELDAAVEKTLHGEWWVWFTCTCGAVITRSADDD